MGIDHQCDGREWLGNRVSRIDNKQVAVQGN